MLTLINSSELNLSVLNDCFIVCKLIGEKNSCMGASSANKVSFKLVRLGLSMLWMQWSNVIRPQVFIRRLSCGDDQLVQYLNIDQEITALCHLAQHSTVAIVGTASHLISYDTQDNKILINKEVNHRFDSRYSYIYLISILMD